MDKQQKQVQKKKTQTIRKQIDKKICNQELKACNLLPISEYPYKEILLFNGRSRGLASPIAHSYQISCHPKLSPEPHPFLLPDSQPQPPACHITALCHTQPHWHKGTPYNVTHYAHLYQYYLFPAAWLNLLYLPVLRLLLLVQW